ncbi:hypothetical protein BP5796_05096 [Coleophoma crateriformis]|uniref:2EXR domain-containing protein n=1 Tax=Coleophoma crateriformis TaxID=565419 RepID=A0A3D8S2A1_9HELO|nr:hypothetical protein BP5796_05096 [Coleophoma crateriformis]
MAANMLDEAIAVIESSTSTGQSAAKFTLFNELPTELRLKIWRHAFFIPQTVVISYMSPGADPNSILPWPGHFKSSQKPPALLHVNSEARKCGQKVYTACSIGIDVNGHQKSVYINLAVDEIAFPYSENDSVKALYWALTSQNWDRVGRFAITPIVRLHQDLYATVLPQQTSSKNSATYYLTHGTILIKAGTEHLGPMERLALQLRAAIKSDDSATVKTFYEQVLKEHGGNINKALEYIFFSTSAVLPKSRALQNMRRLETRSRQQDRNARRRFHTRSCGCCSSSGPA